MVNWKWTALDEATGRQFGRYEDEATASAEAVRRTTLSRHRHTARQAELRADERHLVVATCSICQKALPDVDNIVVMGEEMVVCPSVDCRREAATRVDPGAIAFFMPLNATNRR
jgi:hypothetical protein